MASHKLVHNLLAVGLVTLLLGGCGKKAEPAAKQMPAANNQAYGATLDVKVVSAEEREVSASVQVTGSFVAREVSDVAPQAAGRVIETPIDVGAFVQAGQVIARLEDRDARLRLDQARAVVEQNEASTRQAQSKIGLAGNDQFNAANVPEVLSAKAAYESAQAQAKLAEADAQRYGNLSKTGDVSQSAYEKARTQADTAQAQANSARQQYEAMLNSARQNYQGVMTAQAGLSGARVQLAIAEKAVEDTVIRAPFAGFISARPVAAGQYVATNQKIATLLRITPIRLELQVPEASAAQMKVPLPVEAAVPGFPARNFRGVVTAINPAVDTNSRTLTVIAEFTNQDLALKPGMFATARILLAGSSKGIFVPRNAVISDATTNSSQVFFVRDGRARVAIVQLGIRQDNNTGGGMVQVLSGLPVGTPVAIDPLPDLYDGLTVHPVKVATP